MHIHILGICGTFMGGVAVLARQLGHEVTGSDENVYPPMSEVLAAQGIRLCQGYQELGKLPRPDLVVVGNVISRGNAAIEYVLNKNIPYCSGPEWLAQTVLPGKHVLAVAGTHGKTTTSSLLTWILQQAGLAPGFLIGGLAPGLGATASLGQGDYYVLEADEYDTAFFDKQSKFRHYRPRTLIINNIEFDHADIFKDLAAIQYQFHILMRTVPSTGLVIYPKPAGTIEQVLAQGCWSPTTTIGIEQGDWHAQQVAADGSAFELWHRDQKLGVVEWKLIGRHNVMNALAAAAAAHEVGVPAAPLLKALRTFSGVKRRLEYIDTINGIALFDDFAHHPTAIASGLDCLRARAGGGRLIALLQLGSNSMQMGIHQQAFPEALAKADQVIIWKGESLQWDVRQLTKALGSRVHFVDSISEMVAQWAPQFKAGDCVVLMSNKSFGGLLPRLQQALKRLAASKV